MLSKSEAFHVAFKKLEKEIYFRLTINKEVYEKDRLYSVEANFGLISGDEFKIGGTFSNGLNVVFSEIIPAIAELDEVKAEIGIRLENGIIEYCKLGTFFISENVDINRNDKTTTINCLDNMSLMEGTYQSSLTYPAQIADVALEIANKAGVEVNTTTFARLNTNRINKIEGVTYRQAIGMIAQFECGYALFDRDGKLDIRILNNTDFKITPNDYRSQGLVKNDLQYRLGGISVQVTEESRLQSGSTQGSQINLENSVMTQTLLNGVYSKLEHTNFYPFTLNWWGNPALEVGDWVEISDLEGNLFKAPVLAYKLTFDGGISSTISADVATTSNYTTVYKPPLQQTIQKLGNAIVNAKGEVTYLGLDEPVSPKPGDRWFKTVGPDEELLIYTEEKGWVRVIGTADIDAVKKEVTQAQQTADQAKQDAIKAHDEAVQKAKEETDTLRAEHETMMGGIQEEANSIKQTADKTAADVNLAITAAGFTSLSDSLTGIKGLATTAETNAQKGIANAATALGQANSALSGLTGKADTAFVNAEMAKKVALATYNQKISQIDTAVNSQNLRIDKTEADLRLTATKTDVDAMKGRLTTAELDIQASANGLKLKADKTEVTKAIDDIQVGGRNLLPKDYIKGSATAITSTGFTLSVWADSTLSNDWVTKYLEPNKQYSIAYKVKLLFKPSGPDNNQAFGQFLLYKNGNETYQMSGITKEQYTSMIMGDEIDVRGTFKTPSDLTGYKVYVYTAYHPQGTPMAATMRFEDIIVIRGSKIPDYQEAPEDNEARLTELSTELEVQAGLIAGKVSQTDFNATTGRLTKAEAELVIQANEISKRVATTDFNTLAGRVTETESVNRQQAGLIEQKVSNTTYEMDINNSTSGLKKKVSTAESTLTQHAGLIAAKVNTTEFNALKGTVTTQGTELIAAKNAITAKADKTVVDTVAGRVTATEGRLTVAENGISLAATKTEVTNLIDGIEVGGRNLFTNKTTFVQTISNTSFLPRHPETPNGFRVTGNSSHNGTVRIPKIITDNGWWTVSFDIKGSQSETVGMTVSICDFGSTRVATNNTNTYVRRSVSIYVTNFSESIYNFLTFGAIQYAHFWVDNIKVEKGNKATDWTPAPEDTDVKINAVSASLSVEADKIVSLLTRVSGTETSINQVKSTADSNKATISNHTGRISTVEQNVNGLQTTVANKAEQSQVTQLAGSLSSVIRDFNNLEIGGRNYLKNSSTSERVVRRNFDNPITDILPIGDYVYTVIMKANKETTAIVYLNDESGQNRTGMALGSIYLTTEFKTFVLKGKLLRYSGTGIDNIRMRVYGQDGDILTGKNEKLETGTVSTGWSSAPEEQATQSQITQVSNQINLKVSKGEVSSQINLEAGRTLISTGKLILDANTYIMGTTFANDIKAKSLEAVNADIADLRTKILTANVVESTHIKADTALFDKVFINDSVINKLTSKVAFINSVKAIDISADRVTTGTLNAANVNIINLNVSSLTGNISSFVQSAWNGINSTVNVDANGLSVGSSSGALTRLRQGILEINRTSSDRMGYIGATYLVSNNDVNGMAIMADIGKEISIGRRITGSANYSAFIKIPHDEDVVEISKTLVVNRINIAGTNQYISNSGVDGGLYYDTLRVSLGIGTPSAVNRKLTVFNDKVEVYTEMSANYFNIRGTNQYIMNMGDLGGTYFDSSSVSLGIGTLSSVSRKIRVTSSWVDIYANLRMNNFTISGQSDARLKTNITTTHVKALDLFKRYVFVDFNWITPDSPQERQFGLIAQDTPFLSFQDDEGTWNINSSKQTMLNSLGIKELDEKVTRIDTFVSQHDFEIQKLKKRISELEEKVA